MHNHYDKSLLKEMNDFPKYLQSEHNVSSLGYDRYQASLTPYILEERPMRATQMDIFSRLMVDRVIWIGGPIMDSMSTITQAQLMFLDSLEKKDITMHVDSPGGSVKSGLGIVDVMDYIGSDIVTINTGMAASMGSVILGAGTKGKRCSLRFSQTMLHQSSGGFEGNIQDARISIQEWERTNKILFELLGEFCGKPWEEVANDASRDKWLNATEAKDYGLIDELIKSKKSK